MFIPTAKLVIHTETQTNEANAEIETQPATTDDRISFQLNLNTYMSSYIFTY